MAEIGFAMAVETQRDDVVQPVCIGLFVAVRGGKHSHRDDVVHVGVPADISFCPGAVDTLVAVTLQCFPPDAIPARPVVAGVATFPVWVPLAGEFLREPVVPTFVPTERYIR